MKFPLNAWYVAAWPREVTTTALLARTICNQALILWRNSDGGIAVLEDRCCHREMPLAKGRLEAGTVRCGYHGLRFAGDGRCVEIPGQEQIPLAARVRSYPVIERHGWVWVWPGDAEKADVALVPDILAPNEHPQWESVGGTTYIRANYQLIVDNLLDLTHETYIHPTSLGAEAVVRAPIETKTEGNEVVVTRWMIDVDPGPFWQMALEGATGYAGRCDRWQAVHFVAPSTLALDVGAAPTGTGAREGDRARGVSGWNLNAITPETDQTSWYFWAFARGFQRNDAALSQRLTQRVREIFEEDRAAIESVQQVMNRHPGRRFTSLRIDAGGMAARRVTERLVVAEANAQAGL